MKTDFHQRTKQLSSLFVGTLILTLAVICLSSPACANFDSKELTRSQAQLLIAKSPEFKQPGIISLQTRYENSSEALPVKKTSGSEKVEEAEARIPRIFLQYFPQIAVANHLGLVKIEFVYVRDDNGGFQTPPQWYFTVKARANEKGQAMWKDYGLPPNDEAVPVAQKQFGTVTGITKLAETQAKADFSWKWMPNTVGRALDEKTEQFKTLPAEIQNALTGKTESNFQAQTEDWSGERKVSGLFQRYDDGWRLIRFW